MAERRKPGISVLIATQNEEAVVESCLRSFLPFGDELIVVDNGSTDLTKEIVRQVEREHPQQVRFFDRPDLPDLYQNRSFALAQSTRRWLVRADSDYVCYTSGEYDAAQLREWLLKMKVRLWPTAVTVPQCNVSCDFWHTGVPMRAGGYRANPERQYLAPPVSPPMVRFYRWFPGFDFVRVGRREYGRWQRFMWLRRWRTPVWMHCTLKSDMNFFLRSERSNWRELGDFARYPRLIDYVHAVVEQKYGTADLEAAARLYMQRHVYPYLEPYDPQRYFPYPELVREQMERNPVYRIRHVDGCMERTYDAPRCGGGATTGRAPAPHVTDER